MYHASNPWDFLTVLADSMCTLGNAQMYVMGDTFVVLGPEHAQHPSPKEDGRNGT